MLAGHNDAVKNNAGQGWLYLTTLRRGATSRGMRRHLVHQGRWGALAVPRINLMDLRAT
jgi:hypothetical protein